MLINVLRDEAPPVAVAFDRGEPTFRHEQWVEYKANRRETPADFRSHSASSSRCSTRWASSGCRWPGTRPTTSSPPSPARPSRPVSTFSSSPVTGTCRSWTPAPRR
jgi:hypothetical protein